MHIIPSVRVSNTHFAIIFTYFPNLSVLFYSYQLRHRPRLPKQNAHHSPAVSNWFGQATLHFFKNIGFSIDGCHFSWYNACDFWETGVSFMPEQVKKMPCSIGLLAHVRANRWEPRKLPIKQLIPGRNGREFLHFIIFFHLPQAVLLIPVHA